MPHDESEPTVALTPTDAVPEGARVRHYDELDERAQTLLSAVAKGERAAGSAQDLDEGEIVVYTNYYRIERGEQAAG